MGEYTDDLWETMGLQYVEEFKCFLVSTSVIPSRTSTIETRTISNPNDASTNNRTRSATFPMSIIELRSLLHSTNVSLRRFPLTTVIGPWAWFKVCFVNLRTRLLRSVVFPTPGGPTIATMTGGGSSSGVRLTRGTWRRVWFRSTVLRACLSALRPDLGANA